MLLALLLFAQGAVATYACPALMGARDQSAAETQMVAMPADCEQMGPMAAMDSNTPNLCLAHCQSGQQSNGHADAPTVPSIMPSVFIISLPDPEALASSGRHFASERIPAADSPPHTILHCCFRI